jgi:hypothetical protein
MSRSDDDAAAALASDHAAALIAAAARQLSGVEAIAIRQAVEAAGTALGQVPTKGLPFGRRREIEHARSLLEAARVILFKAAPVGAPPVDSPPPREGPAAG